MSRVSIKICILLTLFFISESCIYEAIGQQLEPIVFSRNFAVGQNHDGRLEIFRIGINGQVYHKYETSSGGKWSENWESLGLNAKSIDVTAQRDGRLVVFGISKDNKLFYRDQAVRGGRWHPHWARSGTNP